MHGKDDHFEESLQWSPNWETKDWGIEERGDRVDLFVVPCWDDGHQDKGWKGAHEDIKNTQRGDRDKK